MMVAGLSKEQIKGFHQATKHMQALAGSPHVKGMMEAADSFFKNNQGLVRSYSAIQPKEQARIERRQAKLKPKPKPKPFMGTVKRQRSTGVLVRYLIEKFCEESDIMPEILAAHGSVVIAPKLLNIGVRDGWIETDYKHRGKTNGTIKAEMRRSPFIEAYTTYQSFRAVVDTHLKKIENKEYKASSSTQ